MYQTRYQHVSTASQPFVGVYTCSYSDQSSDLPPSKTVESVSMPLSASGPQDIIELALNQRSHKLDLSSFAGTEECAEGLLHKYRLPPLVEIPLSAFALGSQVTCLTLKQNKITVLPTCIGKLSGLAHLDVSENELKSLPPTIRRAEAPHAP